LGRVGAPQPSPSEGCDGNIAGVDDGFRTGIIIIGVKIRL
jgi:hypothetical protein